MFVSILQLMGLPFGKPIQSRPEPDQVSGPTDKPSNRDKKGTNRRNEDRVLPEQGLPAGAHPESAQAGASRRQELKAQTAKPAAQAKASAPADTKKKGVQPVAKPAAKPAAKTSAKPVSPPAKTVAKPKAVPPAVESTGRKPSAVPKPVKASAAAPGKPAPSASKPAPASEIRTTPATSPQAAPKMAATPPPVPAKAGRPSRLSQITVPSMAQSVASTAAKASYTNTMSSPVLTPPTYIPARKDPKLANNWKSKPAEQLTDAEVLAMPDEEYMNDKQMAFFRAKLLQLKQGILSNAGETTEHLRADTVIVPDPADRATIEEEHALELRTRDRERKLLKKIEQSIIRIDAGDYGYCDETGEPIGVGRLLARPTATLSLEAQQRRELKQKMFGD